MQDSGAEREVDKHKSSFLKLFAEICKSLYITVSQCIDCGLLKMAHCRLKKKKTVYDSAVPFFWSWGKTKKKRISLVQMSCQRPRPGAGSYLLLQERENLAHLTCELVPLWTLVLFQIV